MAAIISLQKKPPAMRPRITIPASSGPYTISAFPSFPNSTAGHSGISHPEQHNSTDFTPFIGLNQLLTNSSYPVTRRTMFTETLVSWWLSAWKMLSFQRILLLLSEEQFFSQSMIGLFLCCRHDTSENWRTLEFRQGRISLMLVSQNQMSLILIAKLRAN